MHLCVGFHTRLRLCSFCTHESGSVLNPVYLTAHRGSGSKERRVVSLSEILLWLSAGVCVWVCCWQTFIEFLLHRCTSLRWLRRGHQQKSISLSVCLLYNGTHLWGVCVDVCFQRACSQTKTAPSLQCTQVQCNCFAISSQTVKCCKSYKIKLQHSLA